MTNVNVSGLTKAKIYVYNYLVQESGYPCWQSKKIASSIVKVKKWYRGNPEIVELENGCDMYLS